MKELNNKVFKTIFLLLTIFTITGFTIYNIESYKQEYNNIKRNLSFINEERKMSTNHQEPKEFLEELPEEKNKNLDMMMIMDYEVYTVKIVNNQIDRIISHSDSNASIDIESIAKEIINTEQKLVIGNLYLNNYSYNYKNDTIVIINTKSTKEKLISTLIESIIIFSIFEIIIYFITNSLTRRITRPALEAFTKQKDFIADASHELKTPLAIIMASSDELKTDKKNEKYISNIKHESERMSTLIKSLLDLSKLENGVTISTYKEENISKIIERTVLTFEAIAYEHNLKIDTNIEENIIYKCSKDEMEKLIGIILDNAIKHSYKDSTIKVSTSSDKSNIKIIITNKGEGIIPGDEEKIFERFYRADKSRNRDANRYGLGLAIAKNIVTNLGGTITASSKESITTFKIILKK